MRQGVVIAGVIAASAVATAILYFFDPATHNFYPLCFLKLATGLNCPGCGAMRAMHQLLHGNFPAAMRLNLLLLLNLPFALWWGARFAFTWWQGQALHFSIRPLWLWTFGGVATVFTVLRNLPGFDWLSP